MSLIVHSIAKGAMSLIVYSIAESEVGSRKRSIHRPFRIPLSRLKLRGSWQ